MRNDFLRTDLPNQNDFKVGKIFFGYLANNEFLFPSSDCRNYKLAFTICFHYKSILTGYVYSDIDSDIFIFL